MSFRESDSLSSEAYDNDLVDGSLYRQAVSERDRYREALRQIAAWMPDMDAPSAIATDALEGKR